MNNLYVHHNSHSTTRPIIHKCNVCASNIKFSAQISANIYKHPVICWCSLDSCKQCQWTSSHITSWHWLSLWELPPQTCELGWKCQSKDVKRMLQAVVKHWTQHTLSRKLSSRHLTGTIHSWIIKTIIQNTIYAIY